MAEKTPIETTNVSPNTGEEEKNKKNSWLGPLLAIVGIVAFTLLVIFAYQEFWGSGKDQRLAKQQAEAAEWQKLSGQMNDLIKTLEARKTGATQTGAPTPEATPADPNAAANAALMEKNAELESQLAAYKAAAANPAGQNPGEMAAMQQAINNLKMAVNELAMRPTGVPLPYSVPDGHSRSQVIWPASVGTMPQQPGATMTLTSDPWSLALTASQVDVEQAVFYPDGTQPGWRSRTIFNNFWSTHVPPGTPSGYIEVLKQNPSNEEGYLVKKVEYVGSPAGRIVRDTAVMTLSPEQMRKVFTAAAASPNLVVWQGHQDWKPHGYPWVTVGIIRCKTQTEVARATTQ